MKDSRWTLAIVSVALFMTALDDLFVGVALPSTRLDFSATKGVAFAMFFGTFGSIFLLSQFFQAAQGLGPLEAGLRTLSWTAMPMLVAPLARNLSDRIGPRPLMAAGLALRAPALPWLSQVSAPASAFGTFVALLAMAGIGMALVFGPSASVFGAHGGYGSAQGFADGVVAALPVGAAILALGAVVALLVPGRSRAAAPTAELVPAGARA